VSHLPRPTTRRGHRQPHQAAQDGDVRTCETRPAAQADTPGL